MNNLVYLFNDDEFEFWLFKDNRNIHCARTKYNIHLNQVCNCANASALILCLQLGDEICSRRKAFTKDELSRHYPSVKQAVANLDVLIGKSFAKRWAVAAWAAKNKLLYLKVKFAC